MASARLVLATATAAQAAFALVTFALPAIGPELAGEFGLSLTMLGVVLGASLLGMAVSMLAAGVAVDRWGGRPATTLGTALSAAGLLAAAFAPSTPVLVAMLFLSGIGTAAVPIVGMSAVFAVFPVERRGWALGVRQMAVPLSGVVGAIALPLLVRAGGTRAALLFCAGAVALLGAAFALWGAEGAPPRIFEGRRAGPQLRRLLRVQGMRRILVVAFFYVVVLQTVLVFLVPSARDAGLSPFWAGAAFFAMQITAAAARILWGRIADRDSGRRRLRTLEEAGWAAMAGGLVFALALHGGTAAAIVGAVLFAFGALGWNALVYVNAGERAPPELASQAVSIAATLIFATSALSTPVMGAVAGAIGWDAFWILTAGLAACGAVVARTLVGAGLVARVT